MPIPTSSSRVGTAWAITASRRRWEDREANIHRDILPNSQAVILPNSQAVIRPSRAVSVLDSIHRGILHSSRGQEASVLLILTCQSLDFHLPIRTRTEDRMPGNNLRRCRANGGSSRDRERRAVIEEDRQCNRARGRWDREGACSSNGGCNSRDRGNRDNKVRRMDKIQTIRGSNSIRLEKGSLNNNSSNSNNKGGRRIQRIIQLYSGSFSMGSGWNKLSKG